MYHLSTVDSNIEVCFPVLGFSCVVYSMYLEISQEAFIEKTNKLKVERIEVENLRQLHFNAIVSKAYVDFRSYIEVTETVRLKRSWFEDSFVQLNHAYSCLC